MSTQSNGTKTKASRRKAQAKPTAQVAPKPADRMRNAAEAVVDVPVGTVLEVTDRVVELVEPFTDRAGAERRLKSYRASLRRTVKRSERRGHRARRKATTEARKHRNEVEQRVRRTIDERTTRAQNLVDQVGAQLNVLR